MPSGRKTHLTKQVGEYLAAAELCRRGYIASTFTGNVPDIDVLAIDEKFKAIPIQVKASTCASWRPKTLELIDVNISPNGIQSVTGKKKLLNPKLPMIYVKLGDGRSPDEFYICELKDIQNIIFESYKKYLEKHGGRRPRKPESTDSRFYVDDIRSFKDNWKLLERY